MESLQPPLLLIPTPPQPLDVHVQIPRPDDNLFERLIRNPQAPDRPMRERQCAEMLRSVLVACPILARYVFTWLAARSRVTGIAIDQLHWTLETEQSIGSKRDDLRIEGWTSGEEEPRRVVLWTIEIKVAAPLHESSLQEWEEDSTETPANLDVDPEVVNQLVNYDNWLKQQEADHKAGFVLALHDMSVNVPDGLEQRWHCFSWTALALEMEQVLASDDLPRTERPFAVHMLGFIRHRLWDSTDMDTSQLELDDVALLRALAAIGPACSQKVKDLVRQFEQLIRDTGVEFVDVRPSSPVFFDRSAGIEWGVRAYCIDNDLGQVTVSAYVVTDEVRVAVSTYPKICDARPMAHRIVHEREDQLTSRNPTWVFFDADTAEYTIATITKPLVSVLAQDDWQAPLLDFVSCALEDLKFTGILESLIALPSVNDE